MSTPGYRADIDGLRALAVLLVVAYHLDIVRLRGGFVGVDVFFVISGYLISSTILRDFEVSRFSLVSFYERRIRRIFPALLVTLILTSFLSFLYLLPTELTHYAESLVSSTASVSNLYFWKQSGYFDAPAGTKPLLHTWSLAVEEQFYIVFPVFLVAVRRFFNTHLRLSVVMFAAVSFLLSAIGTFKYPGATFYLPHTRAWELLLGTILSLGILPRMSGVVTRNVATLAGGGLILYAGLRFSSATPFPGIAALAPCLGAALIIAGGESGTSIVSRLLSLKPVVFVGLISYSLYLWHWPMIVFQRVGFVLVSGASNRTVKLVAFLVSFVIATLSWKYVELPFRHGRLRMSGWALFRMAGVAALIPILLGLGMIGTGGMPSRFPSQAVRVASYLDYRAARPYRDGKCFISSSYDFENFDAATCLHEDAGKRNELLIGDSHAAQLWYGLSSTFRNSNIMQATASGCKPTLDQSGTDELRCRRLMNYVFADFIPNHRIDALLIAGHWEPGDLPPLARTVTWAKHRGLEVVIFGPMVQYDSPLPRLLAASIKERDPAIPGHHRVADYERLDAQMSQLAQERWGVHYVSFFRLLCAGSSCIEYAGDGVPLQSDYGHLTEDGSVMMAQRLHAAGDFR